MGGSIKDAGNEGHLLDPLAGPIVKLSEVLEASMERDAAVREPPNNSLERTRKG